MAMGSMFHIGGLETLAPEARDECIRRMQGAIGAGEFNLYGAGMGDPDKHTPLELPCLLAGGAHGRLKGGRHVRYPDNTPLMNLLVTMLAKVDVHVDRLGDSTGLLTDL